jgi:hypothetical protein
MLFALILAFIMHGCTQVITDPVELPFEERLVVEAFPEAGKPLDGIVISKTIPPLADSRRSETIVADADVRLRVDGREFQAQSRIDGGKRAIYSVPSLTAESGKQYELIVRWKNKSVRATTTIPFPMQTVGNTLPVLRAELDTTFGGNLQVQLRVRTTVQARASENYVIDVYGIDTIRTTGNRIDTVLYGAAATANFLNTNAATGAPQIWRLPPTIRQDTLSIFRNRSFTNSSTPLPRPGQPFVPPQQPRASARFFVLLYAFDAVYFDYATTLARNSGTGNPFQTGGANPTWNVTGDGFGMFCGMAVREVETPIAR